jgi:predicted RNase H-like HicB family nuclease
VTLQLAGACDITPSVNHYTYRAEWSPEQGEYVGRCIELPWLSQWAPTVSEAIAAIERAVDACIAERNACGDGVPTPLTERRYTGKFVVRTSPALHARLAVEAAEQNVSMNQWVIQKLSGRQPTALSDW